MTELEKLTGGRRPFFINAADGLIQNKKFFLILVCDNTQFSTLESGAAKNELTAFNMAGKTISGGVPINCDGDAFFNKVQISSGLIAAYEATS